MDLEQARTQAQTSASQAGEMAAGSYDIASVLKQKLTDAYDANKDIVEPLDQATANYYSAPATAREKYSNIFNPFQREALVSQYTNQAAVPMLTYSSLYGQRQGSIADTINAGVGGYQAQVAAAQSKADQDRQLYEDLLREYELNQKYTSGGSMTSLMELLQGGNAPQYTPVGGEGSTEGDWIYKNGQWQNTKGTDNLDSLLAAGVLSGDMSATDAKFIREIFGKSDEDMDIENYAQRLNSLGDKISDLKGWDVSLAGTGGILSNLASDDALEMVTNVQAMSMELARMFESGRLSDEDRRFYQNLFPYGTASIENIQSPRQAQAKLNAMINYFGARYGTATATNSGSGGGSWLESNYSKY